MTAPAAALSRTRSLGDRLRSLGRRPLPVHPLLFAAFPVLFLYASNIAEQVPVGGVLASLSLVVGGAAVILVAATAALGDARRGALLTSLWVALFFGYGHVWNVIQAAGGGGLEKWLLIGWLLLGIGAVILAVRSGRRLAAATRGLNAASAALVTLNLVIILVGGAGTGGAPVRAPGEEVALRRSSGPDIYYIVMDRYARADTLRRRFGFDNTPFLDALRDRGFYVADRSLANYPKTAHSLAASLNMEYLGFLTEMAGPGSDDWNPVYDLLRNFRVARALQEAGYRYVHIGSRWEPTRIDPSADVNVVSSGLSEFAQVLYGTTLLSPVARFTGVLAESLDPRERERHRVLSQFERLAEAGTADRPTFVFAHILLPHEPYLFEADGGEVTGSEEAARPFEVNFINQLRYANRRLLGVIDALLARPAGDRPVVLLQADEGPHPQGYLADEVHYDWTRASDADLDEKFAILNAYYLPGITDRGKTATGGPSRRRLYPSISPVNSFRVVFDAYLGADLPLLPDRSYVFVDEEHLYDFEDVTGRLGEP